MTTTQIKWSRMNWETHENVPIEGELTTEHAASRDGRPVLVLSGTAYGPSDFITVPGALGFKAADACYGAAQAGDELAKRFVELHDADAAAARLAKTEAAKVAQRATDTQAADPLVTTRRTLARNVSIALDVDREERNNAWERSDERGAFVDDRHGHVAKARKALADFDAAH